LNLLVFGAVYLLFGGVFAWMARGLEFGEVCSSYVIVPILLLIGADYALEKINSYFASRLQPLKGRVNLSLYMAILNATMYLSVYTAAAFWVFRLTGRYLFVPLILLIGLISGGMVVRKFWED